MPMLGKLHANPADEEHGAKDPDESKAENCGKDEVQSVSPIELAKASDPCHDRETGASLVPWRVGAAGS